MGARFEALDALIFMAPSVLPCIFYLPRFPSGTMCVLILVLNLIQVDHIGIEWDSSIGEILILLFNSKLR